MAVFQCSSATNCSHSDMQTLRIGFLSGYLREAQQITNATTANTAALGTRAHQEWIVLDGGQGHSRRALLCLRLLPAHLVSSRLLNGHKL